MNTASEAKPNWELANRLRILAGYHMGTDLQDRIASAERFQRQQAAALREAADRIDQLEAELKQARAETPAKPRPPV